MSTSQTTFSVAEVFEIAEQIERNGARYYRKAAEKHQDAASFELLKGLAVMEDRHERVFAAIREGLVEGDNLDSQMDPEGLAVAYLQALAGGYIFDLSKDPAEEMGDAPRMEDVLRKAMEMEKESIVFYLGVQQMMRNEDDKDKIERIITEELSHLDMLTRHLVRHGG